MLADAIQLVTRSNRGQVLHRNISAPIAWQPFYMLRKNRDQLGIPDLQLQPLDLSMQDLTPGFQRREK